MCVSVCETFFFFFWGGIRTSYCSQDKFVFKITVLHFNKFVSKFIFIYFSCLWSTIYNAQTGRGGWHGWQWQCYASLGFWALPSPLSPPPPPPLPVALIMHLTSLSCFFNNLSFINIYHSLVFFKSLQVMLVSINNKFSNVLQWQWWLLALVFSLICCLPSLLQNRLLFLH